MQPLVVTYGALGLAILFEVVATSLLLKTEQFTRPGPTAAAVGLYIAAFYLNTFALRALPVGVVYALWSGLGVVLVAGVSFAAYGQRLDGPAILGIALIVGGVAVINLFSTSVAG